MTRTRRAFAVTLAVAAATVVTALPARADGGPRTTAACPVGYLCIEPAKGVRPILVKEGESRQFPGGLAAASLANLTTVTYCVTGSLNFDLPSGSTSDRLTTVTGVAPMGGACLH